MIPIKEGFDFSRANSPKGLEYLLRRHYLNAKIGYFDYRSEVRNGLLACLNQGVRFRFLLRDVLTGSNVDKNIREKIICYLPQEIGNIS